MDNPLSTILLVRTLLETVLQFACLPEIIGDFQECYLSCSQESAAAHHSDRADTLMKERPAR